VKGGLKDTLEAGKIFNVTTVTNFLTFYEISGPLKVVDGGIVSLTPTGNAVRKWHVTPRSKGIQVQFAFPVGADQIPHIFPLGAVMTINAFGSGPCFINPPRAKINFSDRKLIAADAFMVIESVVGVDDQTCIISGKTGTFFNMFLRESSHHES
jgi:hypothetical protein